MNLRLLRARHPTIEPLRSRRRNICRDNPGPTATAFEWLVIVGALVSIVLLALTVTAPRWRDSGRMECYAPKPGFMLRWTWTVDANGRPVGTCEYTPVPAINTTALRRL